MEHVYHHARYFIVKSAILLSVSLALSYCTAQQKDTDMSIEAWSFIKMRVKDRLGDANDTRFPPDGVQNVTKLGDNRFQVTSYIDFKDVQGDLHRTYFYGTIVQNADNWSVESIKLSLKYHPAATLLQQLTVGAKQQLLPGRSGFQ